MIGLGNQFGRLGASNAAGRWTPARLGSAVAAWWDAGQGVTQASGAVSSWADRVGAAAVTQSSASLKPIYSATSLNSVAPGVTFDGTDDVLALVGVPAAFPTGSTAGWMFALLDQQVSAGTAGFPVAAAYGSGTGAAVARSFERVVTAGVNRLNLDNNASNAPENTIDFSGIHAVFGVFGASSLQPRIDGVDGTAVTGLTVVTATTRVRLGAYCGTSATLFMAAVIGHVIVGTGTLSTADKQKLEAWGLWSCGKQANLPVDHPYRNRRP